MACLFTKFKPYCKNLRKDLVIFRFKNIFKYINFKKEIEKNGIKMIMISVED